MLNIFSPLAPTQAGRVGQPTRLAGRTGHGLFRLLTTLLLGAGVLAGFMPRAGYAQTCVYTPSNITVTGFTDWGLGGEYNPVGYNNTYTPGSPKNGAPTWVCTTPFSATILWESARSRWVIEIADGSIYASNTTGSITYLPPTNWVAADRGNPILSGGTGSLVGGPSVTITTTPSQTITSGSSVTLTASGADSYRWSNNSTANPLILTNVTSSSTLSVTGTTDQCSATASAAVKVSATICVSGACAAVNGTYVEVTPSSYPSSSVNTIINRVLFNASANTYMVHLTDEGTSAWLIFPAGEDAVPLYENGGDVADQEVIPLTDWFGITDCEEIPLTIKLGACTSCTSLPDVTIAFPTSASVNPAGPVITVPVGTGLTYQVFGGGSNARYERRIVLDRPNFFEIRAVTENRDGIFPIDRAGSYSIIVTDGNGCSRTVTGEIRGK